jgi:wyosine [tRNA(Phe)-imidazoG37] synthetase (radical SAM superfamily)
MYKYLFGPVPSRRLGLSLGIDLVPAKVCSMNCVYCEAGHTTHLTTLRKEYIPLTEVINELRNYFQNRPDPDYFSFSGSGEPTLSSRIAEVIGFIKENRPGVPVAVITNGSLLGNPEVRKDLLAADLVLPSLDAARNESYQKINRPHPELSIENYVSGLIQFTQEFKGQVWLEVFIVRGLNDTKEDLDALKKNILLIKPHRVQLNTLDRPAPDRSIQGIGFGELKKIIDYWDLPNAEIIAPEPEYKHQKSISLINEDLILGTIARRPSTPEDLSDLSGIPGDEIIKILSRLENEKKVKSVKMKRGIFYIPG